MSPAMLSTAKSSSTVPTTVPSGCGDDVVERGVGNRAAAGDRREPRAAPAAQAAVHAVAMQIGAVAPAPRGDALRQHLDDLVEVRRAADRDTGRRGGRARTARLRASRPAAHGRDDLLRQDVERRVGNDDAVELAAADRQHERRALDQLVARRRRRAAPLGTAPRQWPGAADALHGDGDRSRRSDLAHEIDRADVDAELERRRGDERRCSSPLFSRCSASSRILRDRLPWCAATAFVAEPLGEVMRDALGQPPRVDEDERRAVLRDERGDAVVDLVPQLVRRRRRPSSLARDFDRRDRTRAGGAICTMCGAAGRRPPRNSATTSIGFCVADRPMRGTGRPASASSRSSDSARCAPRLSSATAWISSTMTVSTSRSISRLLPDVSRM